MLDLTKEYKILLIPSLSYHQIQVGITKTLFSFCNKIYLIFLNTFWELKNEETKFNLVFLICKTAMRGRKKMITENVYWSYNST